MRRRCTRTLVLVAMAIASAAAGGRMSRYFPEVGPAAVHQRSLDVAGGAALMVLVYQPGCEDFTLLAGARMASGAQVVTVYATNGGSTPSDASGDFPVAVSAERREEAYRAMSLIGGQAYFLNLPDPGVVEGQPALEAIWDADSAVTRLAQAILVHRPDVVVIQNDLDGDTTLSWRKGALVGLLKRAMAVAGKASSGLAEEGRSLLPWKVQRVIVESSGPTRTGTPAPEAVHPFWKKSYRAIGDEAADLYRTLTFRRHGEGQRSERQYRQVLPQSKAAPRPVVGGFPTLSSRLRRLSGVVRSASRVRGTQGSMVPIVAAAIDSVDHALAWLRGELSNADLRIVSIWKNGLEDLRCSLLGVQVTAVPSDSMLTEYQLFYLTIDSIASRTTGGKTRIFFPMARDHQRWAINESAKWEFDFVPPTKFSILSLPPLPYNTPGSLYGIRQSSARVRFSYIIYHGDTVRAKNFAYRGEVLLRTGPKRTFEMVTPAIRAQSGEPLVTAMTNFSRDGFKGIVTVNDSTGIQGSGPVALTRKDQTVLDTLVLSFPDSLRAGNVSVRVDLSGKGGSLVAIGRRFEALVDSSREVHLLTGIDHGPTELALRRLRVRWTFIDPALVASGRIPAHAVLVLDRDALAAYPSVASAGEALQTWVRNGGDLVIMPQLAVAGEEGLPWASFSRALALPPATRLWTDATSAVLTEMNRLTPADWEEWVVARAWGYIVPRVAGEVIVKDATSGAPLVIRFADGRGRVTYVALDCVSQFQNVSPGAHRFLANLLAGK